MQRREINPWTWQDRLGFVQAIDVTGAGRVLFCSGQTSVDADGRPLHPGDMGAQFNTAVDNLETVLAGAGLSLADVVRLTYYTTDVGALFAAGAEAGRRLLRGGCRPSSTLVGVTRLAQPELMIEIEATAVAPA